jgi:hypothetical protein
MIGGKGGPDLAGWGARGEAGTGSLGKSESDIPQEDGVALVGDSVFLTHAKLMGMIRRCSPAPA